MLLEHGGLVWDDHRLAATEKASELMQQVPSTVAGLIMARFDKLPPEGRRTFQFASVLGRFFPVSLLESITGMERSVLVGWLDMLVQQRFLVEHNRGEVSGYRFRHDLILSTIYNTLLKRNCQRIHGMVAELIESGDGGFHGERIDLLAYHYARSTNRPKAICYLIEAAKKAASRSANETAAEHYRQASGSSQRRVTLAIEITIWMQLSV